MINIGELLKTEADSLLKKQKEEGKLEKYSLIESFKRIAKAIAADAQVFNAAPDVKVVDIAQFQANCYGVLWELKSDPSIKGIVGCLVSRVEADSLCRDLLLDMSAGRLFRVIEVDRRGKPIEDIPLQTETLKAAMRDYEEARIRLNKEELARHQARTEE